MMAYCGAGSTAKSRGAFVDIGEKGSSSLSAMSSGIVVIMSIIIIGG